MLVIVTRVVNEHARLSLSDLPATAPTQSMASVAALCPPTNNGAYRHSPNSSESCRIGDILGRVSALGTVSLSVSGWGSAAAFGSSPFDHVLRRLEPSQILTQSGKELWKLGADQHLNERFGDLEGRTRSDSRHAHLREAHLAACVSNSMTTSSRSEAYAAARERPSRESSGVATLATDRWHS